MTQRKHLEIKDLDARGQVEALIATYDIIDKDGDVTVKGFFGEQPASIVTSHNWGDIMLGKGVIRDSDEGAIFSGLFNLDDPDAAKLHSKLMFDMSHPPAQIEWSYAFDILEGGAEKAIHNGTAVRRLQPLPDGSPGAKIFEVSPVLVGAGEGTGTLAVKQENPEGIKFTDQAAEVMASVQDLIERAEAIRTLRAEQGKHLGSESVDLLTQLDVHLKTLTAVLAPVEPEPQMPPLAIVQAQFEDLQRRLIR